MSVRGYQNLLPAEMTQQKQPERYFGDGVARGKNIELLMKEMVLTSLNNLQDGGMITIDEDGFCVSSTSLGRCMSRFYIAFDTMKHLSATTEGHTISNVLDTLSDAAEFEEFRVRFGCCTFNLTVRNDQKKLLTAIADSGGGLRVPIARKGGWTTGKKVNCLIQAELGGGEIPDFNLRMEAVRVASVGQRILNAMMEIAISKKAYSASIAIAQLSTTPNQTNNVECKGLQANVGQTPRTRSSSSTVLAPQSAKSSYSSEPAHTQAQRCWRPFTWRPHGDSTNMNH